MVLSKQIGSVHRFPRFGTMGTLRVYPGPSLLVQGVVSQIRVNVKGQQDVFIFVFVTCHQVGTNLLQPKYDFQEQWGILKKVALSVSYPQ